MTGEEYAESKEGRDWMVGHEIVHGPTVQLGKFPITAILVMLAKIRRESFEAGQSDACHRAADYGGQVIHECVSCPKLRTRKNDGPGIDRVFEQNHNVAGGSGKHLVNCKACLERRSTDGNG